MACITPNVSCNIFYEYYLHSYRISQEGRVAWLGLLTELHKPEQAVPWVNEALEMLNSEIQADRMTEVLEREVKRFCAFVASMLKRVGASTHPTLLDVEALDKACKALGIVPEADQPSAVSDGVVSNPCPRGFC